MQNEIVDPNFAAGDGTLAEDYEGFERKTLAEGTDLGPGEGIKANRVVGDLPIIEQDYPGNTGGWDTSSHAVPRD